MKPNEPSRALAPAALHRPWQIPYSRRAHMSSLAQLLALDHLKTSPNSRLRRLRAAAVTNRANPIRILSCRGRGVHVQGPAATSDTWYPLEPDLTDSENRIAVLPMEPSRHGPHSEG